MRIGDRVRALAFRTLVAASPLRHADEETLVWREAFDRFQILTLGRIFPGDIRQKRSTQVRDIFTQCQLTVDLDVVHYRVSRILIGNTLGALFEFCRVFLRPPILQVPLGIEVTALVVEPVRQLMTDGRAGVSVVWSVV